MQTLFPELDAPAGAPLATFSECRRYRYRLERLLGDGPMVNFVMLNPSTADETTNDPTIERCERRAREWGFGRLVVTNLFAYRATDPRDMLTALDPVGPMNDLFLLAAARDAERVIVAWGKHGKHRGRAKEVRVLLQRDGIELYALKVNQDGEPGHPLYLPYSARPVLYRRLP